MAVRDVLRVAADVVGVRRREYATCSYVVRDGDRLVCIDGGLAADGSDIGAAVAAAGWQHLPIRAILVTHGHPDHAGGIAALHARGGIRVHRSPLPTYGPGAPWAVMARLLPPIGRLAAIRELIANLAGPVPLDAAVADGDLADGGFRAIATPGHSPDHLAWLHEPTRTLFCGDALAVVGGRLRLMARVVTPDLAMARRSALRCLDLRPAVICAGHRGWMAVDADRLATFRSAVAQRRWPWLG